MREFSAGYAQRVSQSRCQQLKTKRQQSYETTIDTHHRRVNAHRRLPGLHDGRGAGTGNAHYNDDRITDGPPCAIERRVDHRAQLLSYSPHSWVRLQRAGNIPRPLLFRSKLIGWVDLVMDMKAFLTILVALVCVAIAADDEFVPLFNGHDLTGWVNVNCAADTWSVKDGVIHCTGEPTGALRTPRQYENFILELEWRHPRSAGNAGVFIWASPDAAPNVPFLRAIEVQVLDNGYGQSKDHTTHGDVFPIHGATMKPFGRHNGMRSFPSEERSKPSPEWNHYRIVCNAGVIRLHVNGKEVSGGEDCNWRKGYIGLESEGSPVEFRNLRIKELPSTGATAEQSAPLAER